MKQYNDRLPCPKCGSSFRRTKYVSTRPAPPSLGGTDTEADWLKVTCGRCGFEEAFAPLDKK